MRILAIETSCDETAAAVVEDGCRVLTNVIASSRANFERSGGVIPEEAARQQVECMTPVLQQALVPLYPSLREGIQGRGGIDAIAVTKGPGLLGSLLVGTTTARVLASVWKKPLVGVHHHLGHLSSPWLDAPHKPTSKQANKPSFPTLTLTASGGHTELWHRTSHTRGTLLGRTRDDAAGEAFDKGAVLLGLPYPGGPSIAKAADGGDPASHAFPLPLHSDDTLDFSFSGLKTALKYLLREIPDIRSQIPHIAASYEHAICLHLLDKLGRARELHPDTREIHIVGGVAANAHLRMLLEKGVRSLFPWKKAPDPFFVRFPAKLSYCTDNAAMIAAAAEFLIRERPEILGVPFVTAASLPLEEAIVLS